MKDPIIAAMLNFSCPGAGYLYVGRRRVFGLMLVAGVVAATVSALLQLLLFFYGSELAEVFELLLLASLLLVFMALFLVAGGLALDAYLDAKQLSVGKEGKI